MVKRLLLLILITFGIQLTGISQIDSTYQDIEEVFVSSKRKKTIAFEDPKYYIVDFTVSETRTILLMKNFGTYFIYELDEDMNFRHKLRLKVNANSLFYDCFGNTHVVTRDSVYFILNDSFGLFLTEVHPRVRFMSAMKQCAGRTSEKIIFEMRTVTEEYQTFYTVDIDSGYRNIIYQINDSTIAESLRDASILKQMDDLQIGDAQRNKEASVSKKRADKTQNSRGLFSRKIKPQKYNPLFVVDDTLYIFNHAEGRIDQMDDKGNLIDSREIDYQFKKGWKNIVYSDKGRKKFYAVWMRNGAQNLIGLALTEDEQDFGVKITKHAYPEKVVVRNGFVYYAYKPNYDANLNKLYRQKL
ncbi:MAG: hypothetical protein HRT58_04835 [Crocinitomicaceae bacterium]|nr:hypothetical protein [Flavobacteriales bacterium]NQZ34964.1 hypothetical protein [Crocinitomicaceae bacterium]